MAEALEQRGELVLVEVLHVLPHHRLEHRGAHVDLDVAPCARRDLGRGPAEEDHAPHGPDGVEEAPPRKTGSRRARSKVHEAAEEGGQSHVGEHRYRAGPHNHQHRPSELPGDPQERTVPRGLLPGGSRQYRSRRCRCAGVAGTFLLVLLHRHALLHAIRLLYCCAGAGVAGTFLFALLPRHALLTPFIDACTFLTAAPPWLLFAPGVIEDHVHGINAASQQVPGFAQRNSRGCEARAHKD
mmetsp:Transcript_44478/g.141613  ORF Transcript_44478/g.141613 Transcript_44478/m.141613 type:complete len:241 (+) Transcript_44478:1354-2076(+)